MDNYLKLLNYLNEFFGDGKYQEFEHLFTTLDRQSKKNIVEDLKKDGYVEIDPKTGFMPIVFTYPNDPHHSPPRFINYKGRLTLKGFNHLKEIENMKDNVKFSNITNSQIVLGSTNTAININNVQNQPEVIEIVSKIVETLKTDNSISNELKEHHLQIFQTLLIQAQNGQIEKETGMKALTVGDSVSSIGSFLLSLGQILLPMLMR